MPAATKLDLALLAYIQSPQFCAIELPDLRPSTWEAVIELEVPIGCKTSPYDLYVVQGKRIFDWALFRAISSTLDLSKQPLGLIHYIETTVSTDALLVEIFRAVDNRTLLQSVSAIRDGFFAFIGAYWTQAGENIEAVCRWLLPPFEPLIVIIAASYKPTDDQPKPKATRAVTESRNREPHGVLFLRNLRKLPGLFTDPDSSFDTTESSDIASPEVQHSPLKESPARLPSPPAIPPFGDWGLSPLRRGVLHHGAAMSPSVLAFCLPDVPSPSGLSEELGGELEPDLPRRMAALTFPDSQAMLEKDPLAFPDQKFTFRTPPPAGPRVSWEARLKLPARVSPDPREGTDQEAIAGEAPLTNDLTVPKPSTSTPASGEGVRRPLTPVNSPHTHQRDTGLEG